MEEWGKVTVKLAFQESQDKEKYEGVKACYDTLKDC